MKLAWEKFDLLLNTDDNIKAVYHEKYRHPFKYFVARVHFKKHSASYFGKFGTNPWQI